nr:hypothetical protein BaRGS_022652 [Batillaria attramentaria]
MTPYLTSYLRNATDATDLDYTDTIWIGSTGAVSSCLLMPVLGIISSRLPTRLYLFMGVLSTAASMFGTYRAVQVSFVLTVVTYGLVNGIPSAILYPAPIKIAARWLPHKVGLVSGLVLTGYGCGAFAWNQVITWYINPDNLQPDVKDGDDVYYSQPSVLEAVPKCFLFLVWHIADTAHNISDKKLAQVQTEKEDKWMTNGKGLVTGIVLAGWGCGGFAWNQLTTWYINPDNLQPDIIQGEDRYYSQAEAYGQSFIPDDHFLSLVASFSGIANAASRPLWGLLADKIGYRPVAIYAQCILACMVATFVTCEVTGKVAFFIWVIVMFACIGGQYTMMPPIILGLFGSQYYNTLQGLADSNGT